MITVPPYPRLAGNNNKRTPKLMATAIAALRLFSKKANWSVIVMIIVELIILIYTLLVARATAAFIYP
jgi:hypothetical protein